MTDFVMGFDTHYLMYVLGLPTLLVLAVTIYGWWPNRRPDPDLVSEGWVREHHYEQGKRGGGDQ
jgi:hypothetical protein